MMRGTFANIRIKNQMVKDEAGNVVEGGFTILQPSGERLPIFDAAMRYQAAKIPLVVFAGARIRHRLVARLGGQGDKAPRRARRHRAEF